MEKLVSLFLIFVMIFSLLPLSALAAEEEDVQTETEQSLETEGSVGTLLSNTLDGAGVMNDEPSACSVTGISFEGKTATVDYQTDRASELVVAIYEEDTNKMLGSGHTIVTAEASTATVTVEIDSMPAYFTASAYLLEAETLVPLCDAFTSTYYTQEVSDLRQKTAEDFEEERVLLLEDGNTETNFLVLSEDTLVVEQTGDANQITDNGDGTYTITNADESFQNLKEGDSFSYTYADGTVLVVVAKSVRASGTTVTVTADTDAELADMFDYVKIEASSTSASASASGGNKVVYDASTKDEDVDFKGIEGSYDGEASYGAKLSFAMEKKFYDKNDIETTLKWEAEYSVEASVCVYISPVYQYIDFSLEQEEAFSVAFKGKISQEWDLGSLSVSLLGKVVYLKLELKLVLSISGGITNKSTCSNKIGFIYDSNCGLRDTSTQPGLKQPETSNEVTGKMYFGLKASIKLVIIGENVIQTYLSGEVGFELSLKECIADDDDSSKHDCLICFEGDLSVKVEVKVGIKMLYEYIAPEETLISVTPKICDVYYSAHYDEFGFTTCPHKSYKLTVNAVDPDGEAVAAAVKIADKSTGQALKFKDGVIDSAGSESLTTTDGKVEVFLPNGEYTVTLSYKSETKTKDITVRNNATNAEFELKESTAITGPTEADGKIIGSGTCGENVKWALYESGLLYIYGTGAMEDYEGSYLPAWLSYKYCDKIKKVAIEYGVTYIGSMAFGDYVPAYKSLVSVSIPESVTIIGAGAFAFCESLTNITIPSSVTNIRSAFFNCTALKSITIPDSVTSIEGQAFSYCTSLTSVTIPDSVTSIEGFAFSGCTALESITIPKGVKNIGDYAFKGCTSLKRQLVKPSATHLQGIRWEKESSGICGVCC